jgi:hypothetical protein
MYFFSVRTANALNHAGFFVLVRDRKTRKLISSALKIDQIAKCSLEGLVWSVNNFGIKSAEEVYKVFALNFRRKK